MRWLMASAILVSSLSIQGLAQKPHYVRIPREKVLVAIASQPDCPLRIQAATFLLRADQPGVLVKYNVKNIAKKPVSSFQIGVFEYSGTGGTRAIIPKSKLMPGEVLESAKEGSDYLLVPMTAAIKEKLKPENEMQALYILFVEKVFFADGSTYTDEGALKALSAFLVATTK
jgi:hypothetical protein